MAYRCDACGNRTRFDVYESKRVRSFQHFTLGGSMSVEEEEVLEREVERVECRWCGSSTAVVADGIVADGIGGENATPSEKENA